LSNLGKYNNKLIFCSKIFVKNESQETDIYVGETAYQMRYTSFNFSGLNFLQKNFKKNFPV
jgi:hypothetical protein